MYDQGARVTRAQPSVVKSSTSGQQVTVIGQYFRRSAELSCMFGLNDTVQALFMTSTAVQCGAPPRSSGVVKLAVSNNGIDTGITNAWLEYATTAAAGFVALRPSSGPVGGGTRVQVVEGRASEATELACRFGDKDAVAQRGLDGALFCESPPRQGEGGVVTFRMLLGAEKLEADDTVPSHLVCQG